MFNDLFHWLLATFLFAPLQAEIDRKADLLNASQPAIAQARSCLDAAKPALIERAAGDWTWAVTTTVGVAVGLKEPQTVLIEVAPGCRNAIVELAPLIRPEMS